MDQATLEKYAGNLVSLIEYIDDKKENLPTAEDIAAASLEDKERLRMMLTAGLLQVQSLVTALQGVLTDIGPIA